MNIKRDDFNDRWDEIFKKRPKAGPDIDEEDEYDDPVIQWPDRKKR